MKKHFSSYWIRSGFFSFLQRFSVQIFGVITLILLTRTLSTSDMGVWSLFLIITGLFEMAKTSLLKNAHIKYVAGSADIKEKTAIASSSLLINLSITVLFFLLLLIFSDKVVFLLNTSSDLATALYYFIPGLLIMIFFSHLEAIQQSHLDFKGVFAGYFVRQSVFFISVAIHYFFKIPVTVPQLVIYQSISIAVGTIVLYIYSKKYIHHTFNPAKPWVIKIMNYGGYIFGSGILATAFSSVDSLMSSTLYNQSTVAFYSIANRVNGIVDMPSYVAAEILFPKSSKALNEEGTEKVKYMFERMVGILFTFTVPATIGIILFAKLIIQIIAGSGYEPAIVILQIYMVGGIFRPLQNQAASLLNAIGKTKLCFIMNALTVLLNIICNYTCFKLFGINGGAIGTLITLMIFNFFWYLTIKKEVGITITGILQHMKQTVQNSIAFLKNKLNKA